MESLNYEFEEYKMLKEEARAYTDVNFRNIELLIAFIGALIALLGSSAGYSLLQTFWSWAIAQFVVFVFLLVQASRLSYLGVLRQHLAFLEVRLNADNEKHHLRWESEVVPTKVAKISSPNTLSQLLLGVVCILLFLGLMIYSVSLIKPPKIELPYYILVVVECVSLSFLLCRIAPTTK
jgi:small-conductance mechanosensitive channel